MSIETFQNGNKEKGTERKQNKKKKTTKKITNQKEYSITVEQLQKV